jgi:hypothetical protein
MGSGRQTWLGAEYLTFSLCGEPIERLARLSALFVRANLADTLEDFDLALPGETRAIAGLLVPSSRASMLTTCACVRSRAQGIDACGSVNAGRQAARSSVIGPVISSALAWSPSPLLSQAPSRAWAARLSQSARLAGLAAGLLAASGPQRTVTGVGAVTPRSGSSWPSFVRSMRPGALASGSVVDAESPSTLSRRARSAIFSAGR